MTPARFQTIEEIFRAALDQEPDHIGAFLDTACEGDAVLRREVEVLLASDQRAGRFIETSSVGLAAKVIQNQQADSLVGRTIGHYKISESIGTGGMGEVYLATDMTAGRKAALKILPTRFAGDAERLKRFQQEAHAVVALNHPNILTVYEIGEDHSTHYIASELIEGETLRQRLMRGQIQLSEAVDVAIQVASALAAAHDAGIVHRDIKPENIMLRPDGYVKVLDFGIAKLAEQQVPLTTPRDEALSLVETNLGSILGTVRYMSPEQTCGAPVDKRTDIWSLGVVLYEMATGNAPFTGDPPKEVMSAIVETEPAPLTSYIAHPPAELHQIIDKTLRKERAERYQSAHELLEAFQSLRRSMEFKTALERSTKAPSWLRWTRSPIASMLVLLVAALALTLPFFWHRNSTTSSIPEKSIAVLPFENLSEEKANAYFAEGIQNEILTRLATVRDLKVISRTSTAKYQSKPDNLKSVAQELGVSTVLEGAVQKAGDKVRVNVQLVDARADRHLWAKSYDRDLRDVLAVESEVSQEIVDALQANLSPSESHVLTAVRTPDTEAYDLFLRGEYESRQAGSSFTADAYDRAEAFYRQALARDPNFAEAAAHLARSRLSRHWNVSPLAPAELEEVKSLIDRALALAPNSPEAHFALGLFFYWGHGQYEMALTEFNRTLELQPNNALARQYCASVYHRRGEWERSLADFQRAQELDPLDAWIPIGIGETYMALRLWKDAERAALRALAIDPHYALAALDLLTTRLNATGDVDSARRAFDGFPEGINFIDSVVDRGDVARIIDARVYLDAIERRFTDAFQALEKEVANDDRGHLQQLAGRVALRVLAGQTEAAKSAAEEALLLLEARLRERPDDTFTMTGLSWVYLALGRNADALRVSRQAADIISIEKDALAGPNFQNGLAQIEARTGAPEEAIKRLRRLLSIPAGQVVSIARLKIDPVWDPIRNRPDFQQLISGPEQIGPNKSIAVLPFENLSSDPNNAYFADGIQEEILTRLAKIADLKVISRTSTQHYKSAPENLREIATQLGVAHIVEGSVQKSGDAVRVNVQLIKAANDSYLWGDTYDRKLTDIFSVESEVAKAVAEQLRARLTGQEEQVIAAKPTDNVEAHDAYLRGLAYTMKAGRTPAYSLAAQKYLREAVRLDPKFALSWALLSYVDALGYLRQNLQPTVALREEARQAAETALTLQPNLGEAVLAKGYYHYACLKDYDTAVRYFEQARQLLPNSSRIPESLAYVTLRQGQWDRSEAYFNEAERLDPRNVNLFTGHAISYKFLRRFPEALRKFDQVLNIIPDDVDVIAAKAGIAQAEGDLPRAAVLFAPLHPNADDTFALETQAYQAILERHPAPIILRLKEILAKPDPALGYINGELRFWLGWAQEVAGDHAAAQESWRQARSELESFLKEQPENDQLIGDLALINMGLGDKAAAFKLIEREMAAVPIEKDAIDGPHGMDILARVAARMGEPDRAIAALQKLLSIPSDSPLASYVPLTPALLRLDPMFDQLRNDPRFEKILKESKNPVTLK